MRRIGIAIILAALASGCNSSREVVEFSGTVRLSSGEPANGVRIVFEPTDGQKVGATFGFDLENNGHFDGVAFPGRYAYYLSTVEVERDDDTSKPANQAEAKKLKKSSDILNTYPTSYRTWKQIPPDHVIEVRDGCVVEIVVAN